MAAILVVEDDIDLCDTYVDALQADGHTLYSAHTSTEAMDTLIRNRIVPDVVILDIQLPGDSGLVVLSLIRGLPRLSKTKVIIASGHSDIGQWAVVRWGADLFLQKPVSLDLLKKAINDFISNANESAITDARVSTSNTNASPIIPRTNHAPNGS